MASSRKPVPASPGPVPQNGQAKSAGVNSPWFCAFGQAGLVRIEPRLRLPVCLQVTDDEADVRGVARLPGEAAAERVVIVAAAVRDARHDGLHVAVILVVDERKAALEVVGERARHRAVHDDLVEAAVRQVGVGLECVGGLARDELDGAAGGIPAEQRALRAAQRLDAREVEHREAREVDRARVAVVLVDRDRRFLLVAVVVLRDAADVEHDLRARVGIHLEARHRPHDVRRVGDVEVRERLFAERRHRDADVLQLLLAPLGRDDDLVEAREVVRLRGRRRRFGLVGAGQLRAAAHHRRKKGDPNRAPDIRRLHARHDNPPRIDSCIQPRT